MGNLKKLFLTALAVGGMASSLNATTILQPGRFYCDFATGEDFDQWTIIDVNGPSSSEHNFWFYSAAYGRAVMKNGNSQDGDDWFISPSVTLEEGKKYNVKIFFKADYPCTFDLTYGTDATVESQISVSGAQRWDGDNQYAVIELPEAASGGDFNVGIHVTTSKSDDGWLYIYSVDVAEARDGSIDFEVLNSDTNTPISGVDLKLVSPTYLARTFSTSEDGHVKFESLTPGEYTATLSIDGFNSIEPITVNVGNDEDVNYTINAVPLIMKTISGKIVDYKNRPISGVNVALDGSRSYSATTADDGTFSITDVRCPETYSMSINHLLYTPYNTEIITTSEDIELNDIILEPFFGQPADVSFDKTQAGMFVSWLAPIGKKEFKYDNGKYGGMHTIQGNYIEYVHFGVKFDEPMIVEDISWVVCELKDEMVDLAIYPLTPDGAISTTAAFSVKGVPSDTYRWTKDMEWQHYALETPLEMPYGCLVSVGHTAGGMNMALDYVNNWGPSYTSKNDLEEGWKYANISNFFIRVNGTVLSRDLTVANQRAEIRSSERKAPVKAPMLLDGISYKVWRIAGDVNDNRDNWTPISNSTNGLYVIDSELESLNQGIYHYAVQAINYDGTESDPVISDALRHRLNTDINVSVYTNTAIDFADGAYVTLTDENSGEIFEGIVVDNNVKFIGIPKGSYSLRVKRAGFAEAVYGNLNYNNNSEYSATVYLSLIAEAPFALNAVQAKDSKDVLLEWNQPFGIFDDFEGIDDFEVNPAGEFGYTYADIDGSTTYGVAQCQQTPYPNMFSPMAFMSFNPYATNPDLSAYVQPYSGEKVLISVSLENGERNNDYMFSPELSFDVPFTLRFQAAAGFFGSLGRERFMVGYTTGAPEPENVIWLTDVETVGGLWKEFSYTLPAEARHAVIRCVSDQTMFFMLDDLFIGQEEADIFAMTSFNVYLDDELMGTTSNRAFAFVDLEEGKHLAKVQTVYQMADMTTNYSDFTEILFKVEHRTTGIADVDTDELYSYSAATRTLTAGASAASMTVYDIQGRAYADGKVITFEPSDKGIYLVHVVTNDGQVVVRKLAL